MNPRIVGGVLLAWIVLSALPCHSQGQAWSVSVSSRDSNFLEIVLRTELRVGSANCLVNLYDTDGHKSESRFTFKEDDGHVLEPGLYKRFVAHNCTNLKAVEGIQMFCLPPLPPGLHPMVLPIRSTDQNLWDDTAGIILP